ncbi:helix-turn-helix transcriptional regulator [Saccharothrix violaceirubra]|uniref:helix-turn-helix domain-containing protein n=2 Tax=Saccharothrix violaceirubra TaxID=413306 RepID=UPI0031EE4E10
MRTWRDRLEPNTIPGLVTGMARRRRKHVSQEDVARLIGVSTVWYGKLERGEPGNYSADLLDRTAITLRLNEDERAMLHLCCTGREPAQQTRPAGALSAGLRAVIDRQTWPAYVSDCAWDILAWNAPAQEWFPWIVYEQNLMRWVFTYPEARHQLHRWDTDWAPLMIAQMQFAHARLPDNFRLAALIREILACSAEAREMWSATSAVAVHPDGDVRGLCLPDRDEVIRAEIVALSPLRSSDCRLVMLVPVT